ncbi:MAG: hypothetical protein ACK5VI_10760 [Opitutia bacterium]|jgi:hypothetical protein
MSKTVSPATMARKARLFSKAEALYASHGFTVKATELQDGPWQHYDDNVVTFQTEETGSIRLFLVVDKKHDLADESTFRRFMVPTDAIAETFWKKVWMEAVVELGWSR